MKKIPLFLPKYVFYKSTFGDHPLATIQVERGGTIYEIKQAIKSIIGVQPGDELWIAQRHELSIRYLYCGRFYFYFALSR
ncbi:hypothetical protein [Bacillus sp. NPDC077027]|uniref:hypothetical protein n=1 Tax=Bacillus sp. NPDC077027 TaxID=3390548 RepID=UPI003D047F19